MKQWAYKLTLEPKTSMFSHESSKIESFRAMLLKKEDKKILTILLKLQKIWWDQNRTKFDRKGKSFRMNFLPIAFFNQQNEIIFDYFFLIIPYWIFHEFRV